MTTAPDAAREGEWIDAAPAGTAVRVTLAWPLRRGRRRLQVIDLRPPTLGDLEALSSALEISAADVLAAASTLPASVVRRLRWTDVEALLEAAKPLFPAGFFDRFDEPDIGADPRAGAPAEAVVTTAAAPTDPDDETLPAAEAVDMADFVTPFHL